MPDERADDREPGGLGGGLDRVGDVAEPITGDALLDTGEERLLGRLEQVRRGGADRADGERAGGVRDPAVERDADVEGDDVAALELVGPGYSVDDHRVRGSADRARETPVALESRDAPCERM